MRTIDYKPLETFQMFIDNLELVKRTNTHLLKIIIFIIPCVSTSGLSDCHDSEVGQNNCANTISFVQIVGVNLTESAT